MPSGFWRGAFWYVLSLIIIFGLTYSTGKRC